MNVIEAIYETVLSVGIATMVMVCLSLPKKLKYTLNGKVKLPFNYRIIVPVSIVTICAFLFMSCLVFAFALRGDVPQEDGSRGYLLFRPHWVLSFIVLLCLSCSTICRIVDIERDRDLRLTILYMVRKYGLRIEQLDNFCDQFKLATFPVAYFEKNFISSDNRDTALVTMTQEMEQYSLLREKYLEMITKEKNINACKS